MKSLLHTCLKFLVRIALRYYYRHIRIYGLDALPRNEPLILLANHQNGLMDPLIIAAFIPGKPYILTRSDVFGNWALGAVFRGLRMLPVYRIRDGRQNLTKNSGIFRECSTLLAKSEQLLVFPEANHCLERRVRPLSKGFTRILFRALDENPHLEVYMAAVGVNYIGAAAFPDAAAFYFGRPEAARKYHKAGGGQGSAKAVLENVGARLRELTTHIPVSMVYVEGERLLVSAGADYLKPAEANGILAGGPPSAGAAESKGSLPKPGAWLWDSVFVLFNLPVILIWRSFLKPRVGELEFLSTYRFLFAMFLYPPLYLLCFYFLLPWAGIFKSAIFLSGHVLFNRCYIKFR